MNTESLILQGGALFVLCLVFTYAIKHIISSNKDERIQHNEDVRAFNQTVQNFCQVVINHLTHFECSQIDMKSCIERQNLILEEILKLQQKVADAWDINGRNRK